MNARPHDLARAFEARTLDPAAFSHRDHVAVACDMLGCYDFLEAAARYAESLKAPAAKAGVPEKFNATVTLAFLSLIAKRMRTAEHADCDDFIARNPDLLSKDVLEPWYAPERLRSDLARQVFLMPEAPR
jgi:hypothetical protein